MKPNPKDKLILTLLECLDGLAGSRMAIVQARQCHPYFTRKAKKLGIKVKPSPWVEWVK